MATFGHKIAAAREDGVVGIYDSVTGVLRLSLSLVDPAHAVRGSPDGSILFFAHKTPSITMWDIQTGGLIHTFVLERNAEDIAVSLKGRYLACGLSDGSVEVWEVANKIGGGAAICTRSPVTGFCWLLPEEQLAVSASALVQIWDIIAGTTLHSFTIWYPVHRMVYSQKFDRLAVMATSPPRSAIAIIDPQAGKSTRSRWIHQSFSCLAFSQTTEELVCGMETDGLRLFNVPAQLLKHIEHPDTMTSVSCLQNGTVVANFAGSGIQLLNLDGSRAPSQQPIVFALTVCALDEGRIIGLFPTSRDHILLLGSAVMSQLLQIPVPNSHRKPTDYTTVLWASYRNTTAVYYFEDEETGIGFLQSWKFYEEVPRWTVKVADAVETCRISPTAVRLVTLHVTENLNCICVWNAQNGQLETQCKGMATPRDIKFYSDTEFCLYGDMYDGSYTIGSGRLALSNIRLSLPMPKPPQSRYLDVDDTHEWVVGDSKRVCWIPPGYIGPFRFSYCWVSYSLVMVGQDGVLRKLTFSCDDQEK